MSVNDDSEQQSMPHLYRVTFIYVEGKYDTVLLSTFKQFLSITIVSNKCLKRIFGAAIDASLL